MKHDFYIHARSVDDPAPGVTLLQWQCRGCSIRLLGDSKVPAEELLEDVVKFSTWKEDCGEQQVVEVMQS